MDTKSERSKHRLLLLKDFVVDEDDRHIFSEGNYDIVFFDGFIRKPKKFIQVWYREGTMRYLKDESVMDWGILKYRAGIDERNKKFWDKINKFYEEYFINGDNDSSRVSSTAK